MHPKSKTNVTSRSDFLVKRVLRLGEKLEIDKSTWLEILGISSKSFDRILLGKEKLGFFALADVSEVLKVNIDDLVFNNFDFLTLKARAHGDLFTIPEKYTYGGGSYCRSIQNHINYLEYYYYGPLVKKELLDNLQLTSESIMDEKRVINLGLIKDITDFFRKINFGDSCFYHKIIFKTPSFRWVIKKLPAGEANPILSVIISFRIFLKLLLGHMTNFC